MSNATFDISTCKKKKNNITKTLELCIAHGLFKVPGQYLSHFAYEIQRLNKTAKVNYQTQKETRTSQLLVTSCGELFVEKSL